MAAIIPHLTPSIARYVLFGTFTMSGLSKFGPTKPLNQMFPKLPNWFWKAGGLWEAVIVTLLYLKYEMIALIMAYVFLGGVFCAVSLLKDHTGKSQVEKSYGGMLVPCIFTFVAVMTVGDEVGMVRMASIPAFVTGIFVAIVLSKSGHKLK